VTKDILEFQSPYRWLSNFWPCSVELDGVTFPSVEHAYQAAKFPPGDPARLVIQKQSSGTAKRLGMNAPLRATWDTEKLSVMENLLRQKFAPDTELAQMLINTGEAKLQEGNSWNDTFWGVDIRTGLGQNMLGKLLMQIRGDLTA
jgi:ribA/ribD-fused uncharacterized protein